MKQGSADRLIAPLGHIIPIPSHPGFALTLQCNEFTGEATHNNSIVFSLAQPGIDSTIYWSADPCFIDLAQ
jgi:hypothetical protein